MINTGLVIHPDFAFHTNPYHPERQERLEAIEALLEKENLWPKIKRILPVSADMAEVEAVHPRHYLKKAKDLAARGVRNMDADTYLTIHSFDIALLSAGAALEATRAVLEGRLKTCFSLGRPPGHHAEPHRGMGFCLLNNGAIAARYAKKYYGLSRILYLDWDVHHGNGVQATFYHDPEVLYFSVHQSPLFPGTGGINETGEGKGKGYTVNVPLPPGAGDADYEQVFSRIVRPLAEKYRPELIMVSAGQDAYHGDPVSDMCLSFHGFAMMAKHLKEIAAEFCGGKAVLFLEGGYNLEGQAEALVTILGELAGWQRPVKNEEVPSQKEPGPDLELILSSVCRQNKQLK